MLASISGDLRIRTTVTLLALQRYYPDHRWWPNKMKGSGISGTNIHLGGEWQLWIDVLPKDVDATLRFEPSTLGLKVK